MAADEELEDIIDVIARATTSRRCPKTPPRNDRDLEAEGLVYVLCKLEDTAVSLRGYLGGSLVLGPESRLLGRIVLSLRSKLKDRLGRPAFLRIYMVARSTKKGRRNEFQLHDST